MTNEDEKPRGNTLTVNQVAALCGRSTQWVHQLVKDGFVQKQGKNQYTLVSVVRGVIAYYEDLQSKSSKTVAASRATEARTREIELRIAERRRELIAVEDARAVVLEFGAIVKSEFGALPARYTREMTERRKLEQEVNGSFERISAAARRSEAALADPERDLSAKSEA
ncbi:hypothetical protein [Thalassobacter stenotrophicus]|uniref:Phage DNA packaging protein Nu1 n=2 Tax=Thalassobacter stenotrophicus TaxID=266809 RepID=A0A0P1EYK4_9RHOB|nr:hypothetical protein [Thalassobacter stenotrophicus]CUH60244.1 hypothetical protein THS5294_01533 [Thalassobacter stenotrophicus]SHI71103.1 hypothetical protein SAMN02744035_01325 [Thalassobacter stenotrophicus DSM 16310]